MSFLLCADTMLSSLPMTASAHVDRTQDQDDGTVNRVKLLSPTRHLDVVDLWFSDMKTFRATLRK